MLEILYCVMSGRSREWPRVSRRHLLDNAKCVCCLKRAVVVHHKTPVSVDKGLELDAANLASMCKRCHFVFGHYCNWADWNRNFDTVVRQFRAAFVPGLK